MRWIHLLRYRYHILHQGTLILNSWRAQLDMMWILKLWICIEIFLLVYWDFGLFAFVKDCEHILYLRGWFKFLIGICENCPNIHNIVDISSKNIVAIGYLIGIVLKPMY